jgi:hypothetical protein
MRSGRYVSLNRSFQIIKRRREVFARAAKRVYEVQRAMHLSKLREVLRPGNRRFDKRG